MSPGAEAFPPSIPPVALGGGSSEKGLLRHSAPSVLISPQHPGTARNCRSETFPPRPPITGQKGSAERGILPKGPGKPPLCRPSCLSPVSVPGQHLSTPKPSTPHPPHKEKGGKARDMEGRETSVPREGSPWDRDSQEATSPWVRPEPKRALSSTSSKSHHQCPGGGRWDFPAPKLSPFQVYSSALGQHFTSRKRGAGDRRLCCCAPCLLPRN